MRKIYFFITTLLLMLYGTNANAQKVVEPYSFKAFTPPISFEQASARADALLSKMSLEDKAEFISGYNLFFIKGFEKYNIPQLYLSDATQGAHIRKELSSLIEKSTAFPSPLALTATWNPQLAHEYAKSIGEECRVGDIAVLLGPGMNIYRQSQNGRNFEYFGEDPFLAARMIENYVVGMQSTGTIATLKHFLCNNTDYCRRMTNSIVSERTLHEIYLPAFQAGVNAGALAVMTSYNKVNGEWAGQSNYVINKLLRGDLGFKGLVMSDWWSTWNPEKTIKSGLDLEMPGPFTPEGPELKELGNIYVKTNALRLLNEKKVSEADMNRMAKNIMTTCISMGLYDRPVKDLTYLSSYPKHAEIALQTAREATVLLRNEKNILPLQPSDNKILLVGIGNYVNDIARGGGSAEVEGYDQVSMLKALKNEFGDRISFKQNPSESDVKNASTVLISIGTSDSEGYDRPYQLPDSVNNKILTLASLNARTIVIVNAGGGIEMTPWNKKVAGIIFAWYPGQNGHIALAEILSGKTNPSGKLPITLEKKFEDSPGFGYMPAGEKFYTGWERDMDLKRSLINIEYKEGVLVGYRWYETKKIEPLYHFGYGLSYTTFAYSNLSVSTKKFSTTDKIQVEFTLTNTGKVAGDEIAQLYVHDKKASVVRPIKELKSFSRVNLQAGESKRVKMELTAKDFSFYDEKTSKWVAESGDFEILIGCSSNNMILKQSVTLQ